MWPPKRVFQIPLEGKVIKLKYLLFVSHQRENELVSKWKLAFVYSSVKTLCFPYSPSLTVLSSLLFPLRSSTNSILLTILTVTSISLQAQSITTTLVNVKPKIQMDGHISGNHARIKASMLLGGTAKEGNTGPPLGLMDIGVGEDAYLFRVALPGLRKNECSVKCEILHDGTVNVRGVVTPNGGILRDSPSVFQLRVQQLCPPGPFSISFKLPGPVDPRLFCPNFRADGVMEGVVMKPRVPIIRLDG